MLTSLLVRLNCPGCLISQTIFLHCCWWPLFLFVCSVHAYCGVPQNAIPFCACLRCWADLTKPNQQLKSPTHIFWVGGRIDSGPRMNQPSGLLGSPESWLPDFTDFSHFFGGFGPVKVLDKQTDFDMDQEGVRPTPYQPTLWFQPLFHFGVVPNFRGLKLFVLHHGISASTRPRGYNPLGSMGGLDGMGRGGGGFPSWQRKPRGSQLKTAGGCPWQKHNALGESCNHVIPHMAHWYEPFEAH